MEDPRNLTKAQYEKMEKTLEERTQMLESVEFYRFSNHLGEIWVAMQPSGAGNFRAGFALCNPTDKSKPRRYRRWKGRHVSLSRMLSERRPVSIKITPPIESEEDRGRAIRDVIIAQLFEAKQKEADPFPPSMFGLKQYRGISKRSAFRSWVGNFVDQLYNDIQAAKYRAEAQAKNDEAAGQARSS